MGLNRKAYEELVYLIITLRQLFPESLVRNKKLMVDRLEKAGEEMIISNIIMPLHAWIQSYDLCPNMPAPDGQPDNSAQGLGKNNADKSNPSTSENVDGVGC